MVCRKQNKFAQSSPVGLHTVAKSLHLVCNWCAGSKIKFALCSPVSLHTVAKVYIETEMFTSEDTKQQKNLHFGQISLHFAQLVYNIYQKNAEKFT